MVKEYKIKLFFEEMETLKKGNGKWIDVIDDEEEQIKIKISFKLEK